MKKLKNGRRVLTGQVTSNTYDGLENRIQLNDGLFTTGYRIVSFKISPLTPTTSAEVMAKITTEPKSTVTNWYWQDVQELAWAFWGSDKYLNTYMELREDNMAIEDLWISAYNSVDDDLAINYEIVLEKYEFPAWTGAGVLVENLSQAGPQ
jgi:hypothetical protein